MARSRCEESSGSRTSLDCYRENIINAPESDWTEWQAGWVSGAILMPANALRPWAAEWAEKLGTKLPFAAKSPAGVELIRLVAERCDVSVLAARVRLTELRLVVEDSSTDRATTEKAVVSPPPAVPAAAKNIEK